MQPGPIQQQWLKNLREHPERQLKNRLGIKKEDDTYQACCLGELLICAGKAKWDDGELIDQNIGNNVTLDISSKELGLYSSAGENKNYVDTSNEFSLANINDDKTWKDVADAVEGNFENYFNKSY